MARSAARSLYNMLQHSVRHVATDIRRRMGTGPASRSSWCSKTSHFARMVCQYSRMTLVQKGFTCFASTARCSPPSKTARHGLSVTMCRFDARFYRRLLQHAANTPALRPTVKIPSGNSNIQVTHMRHPQRRLSGMESHFARMEKCGAQFIV